MRLHSFYIIVLAALFLGLSCKKAMDEADCRRLENGMITDNKDQVREIINQFISVLSSDNYTVENVNKLAEVIGSQCGMSAIVYCFDCIQTMPSQSEIRLSFSNQGFVIAKTIDISYTTTNKMAFASMHN